MRERTHAQPSKRFLPTFHCHNTRKDHRQPSTTYQVTNQKNFNRQNQTATHAHSPSSH